MSEENVTQGEGNEEQEVQTVTAEQFEAAKKENAEVKKMLEDLKKAQSGSDNKVTELQKLLKLKEEEGKSEEQKFAERLAEVENKWKSSEHEKQQAVLKSVAIQLLSDEGIKAPKYLNRLIGDDEEETKALITDYIEEKLADKLEERDDFAKKNGRKVEKGKSDIKTQDDYTEAELESMSDEEFFKIQKRSKK